MKTSEQKLRKVIRKMISESTSDTEEMNGSYSLILKNNHPNSNINKKININFKPLSILGKWDVDKIMKAINNDSNLLVSGTDIELIDNKGKSIKKGKITGWNGEKLIIQ
jgi:hypothetical protein